MTPFALSLSRRDLPWSSKGILTKSTNVDETPLSP